MLVVDFVGGRRFVGGGGGEGAWDTGGWAVGDEDEVGSEEMLAEHGERLGGGF